MIIFVCDYFITILYEFIFIFIQEKEAEKSDQATVARGVAQAEDVSVFLLHSTVTDHRTLHNLQHLDQLLQAFHEAFGNLCLFSIIQEKEPVFELDFSYLELLPHINMMVADLIQQVR